VNAGFSPVALGVLADPTVVMEHHRSVVMRPLAAAAPYDL